MSALAADMAALVKAMESDAEKENGEGREGLLALAAAVGAACRGLNENVCLLCLSACVCVNVHGG